MFLKRVGIYYIIAALKIYFLKIHDNPLRLFLFIVQCPEECTYITKTKDDNYWLGLLPLGRVPPGFLVGEGARDWAIRHGIHTVSSEKLVSDKAVKLYKVST